jgi:hypothetical protein
MTPADVALHWFASLDAVSPKRLPVLVSWEMRPTACSSDTDRLPTRHDNRSPLARHSSAFTCCPIADQRGQLPSNVRANLTVFPNHQSQGDDRKGLADGISFVVQPNRLIAVPWIYWTAAFHCGHPNLRFLASRRPIAPAKNRPNPPCLVRLLENLAALARATISAQREPRLTERPLLCTMKSNTASAGQCHHRRSAG